MQPPNNNPDFPSFNDPLPPQGSSWNDGSYNPGGVPSGGPGRREINFDVISDAWKVIQPHLGIYVVATLIVGVMVGFFAGVQSVIAAREAQANSPTLIPQAIGLITNLVAQLLTAGFYRMAINHLRTGTPQLGDIFTAFDVILSLIVAAILTQVALIAGCCACFIGLFVVNGLLMFTVPLIVDQKLGPIEAMTKSFEAAKPQMWMAAVFMIVIGLLAGVGVLACGVGALITVPLAVMAVALTYRNFFMSGDTPLSGGVYPNAPIADPGL